MDVAATIEYDIAILCSRLTASDSILVEATRAASPEADGVLVALCWRVGLLVLVA